MHVFSKTNHNDSLLLLVLREYFPWVLTTEQEHGLSSCLFCKVQTLVVLWLGCLPPYRPYFDLSFLVL
jgi:hypothetical protein